MVNTNEEIQWKKWSVIVTVGMCIMLHSGTALWWASTITNKLDNVNEKLSQNVSVLNDKIAILSVDHYTGMRANLDFAIRDQQIKTLIKEIADVKQTTVGDMKEVKTLITILTNKLDTFMINYYRESEQNVKSKR